jgi:IPT/TIG domain
MESIKDRSTLNWTTDDRKGRTTLRRGVTTMALVLAMGLISVSAFAQQLGTLQADNSTISRGSAFISDNNGGHWWVSDSNLGLCELVTQNLPNQPPLLLNFCNQTALSGGQVIVGNPSPALALPANAKFVYVAENVTLGISVARLVFSPSANGGNGGFTGFTKMNIPNASAAHGVVGKGGRPVGIALLPHNGVALNGGTQDLYVSYVKSGDITRVEGIDNVALVNSNPTTDVVGSTSDGIGTNGILAFGNDLYLAETGGFGFSMIQDPSGITRVPCSALAPCTALHPSPVPSTFPGGLTTDWVPGTPTTGKGIFIGDSPRAGGQHSILRYDPATSTALSYSLNINPAYTENDVNGVLTTWTAYVNPLGLGYNAANGDLLVGDDPQGMAATPVFQQGHIWKVTLPGANPPSVTSIAPASGSSNGGDVVTITGLNLAVYNSITGAVLTNPNVSFGTNAGLSPSCAPAAAPPTPPVLSTCTVTSPSGFGIVDVRVAIAGQSSAAVAGDLFTYTTLPSAITVFTVTPNSGATIGDTQVTITGQNLANYDLNTGAVIAAASFNFGAGISPSVTCLPTTVPVVAPVLSTCTARSPAGAAGTVDVQATLPDALGNPQTSAIAPPGDQFTYIDAVATLYAWGITAPKGGATFIPGALGGHWWSSDHAQGLCRQDIFSSAVAPYAVAGNTLHAINFAVCGADIIGSAGQAAYDPNVVPGTTFHYVYVPDNAVKSTAVWRLTFDPATETMVADPFGGAFATAMAPLADQRTLKPNGMALGPDGNLYITDLVEMNVRVLTTQQDPRLQTITIVAVTGDGRGANGTQGFIGNLLYISGNRATQFFDITQCPLAGGPCGMASVPAPNLVFIAGTATDAAHKLVYLSNSPGPGPMSLLRYDASSDVYVPFAPGTYTPDLNGVVHCTLCSFGPVAKSYITGGLLPAPGTPNGTVTASTTFIRPWDQTNHSTAGILAGAPVPTTFAFAFGLATDSTGTVVITEDPSAGARSGRGTMWTIPYIP